MNQREPEKSAKVLEDVLAWNSTDAETRFHLGIAYKFSNRPKKSLQELEAALQLDPEFYLTHFYLGTHYIKSSRGKAKRHLNKFLKFARNQKEKGPLIQKAEDLLKNL